MSIKLFRDVLIYGVIGGLGKSLMLLLVPIYTRVFTPEEYGSIDLITAVITFLTILGMLQFEASSGRYFYDNSYGFKPYNIISTSFYSIAIFSLLLIIPVIVFSGNIANLLFDKSEFGKFLQVGALIVLTGNLFHYLMAMMRYVKEPVFYGAFFLTQILMTLVMSILLVVYFNYGIVGVFYGQLLGFSVGLILVSVFMYKRNLLFKPFSVSFFKHGLRYSLPLLPGLLGNWGNQYLNRFLLLGLLSLTDIGLLSLALKLAVICQLIETALKMAWSPYVYENVNNENHKNEFRKSFIEISVIVFSLIAMVALLIPEIFELLIDPSYFDAKLVSVVLIIAFSFRVLNQVVGIGSSIVKKTYFNSIISIVSLIVNVVFLYLLVPYFGLLGVALSLLISILTFFVWSWALTERLYPINFDRKNFLFLSMIFVLVIIVPLLSEQVFIVRFFLVVLIATHLIFRYKSQIAKMTLKGLLSRKSVRP